MRYLLTILILLIHLYCYSQTANTEAKQVKTQPDSVAKVAWLKKHAISIKSIDSTVDNFSDLMPLKKAIGEAQVVFLGESGHWIGPFYYAKTRLIKFLHQEMSFDVLAYESSIDGTATTWNIMKEGGDSREAFKNSVTFGSERVELQPLRRYLEEKATSGRPLQLIGFDSQMTGRLSFDSLLLQLRRFFSSIGYATPILNDTAAFGINLRGNSQLPIGGPLSSTKYNEYFDTLINVIDSLAPRPHSFEAHYYKQVLKSVKKSIQGRSLFGSKLSGKDQQRLISYAAILRDEQMADNLLWYIKQYPNRKFIVSAHNTHLLTEFDPLYPASSQPDNTVDKYRFDIIQMGYLVKDSLGNKVYNIAMVGNRGSQGRINLRDSTYNFKSNFNPFSKKEELENLLYAAGFNYAFVNLKNPPKGGEWLKGRFPLRHYSGVSYSIEAEWHKLIDGVFYIRELSQAYIR